MVNLGIAIATVTVDCMANALHVEKNEAKNLKKNLFTINYADIFLFATDLWYVKSGNMHKELNFAKYTKAEHLFQ